MPNKMYKENRKTINWFVGCKHDCVYCRPSFQRQMMRQKKRCLKCYNYEPHAHLERLLKRPPKTVGDEFVFFPSSGDLAFASPSQMQTAIEYAKHYPNTTFLMQSKNPECFLKFVFPPNVILATTIETNQLTFFDTPSKFTQYSEISKAPFPHRRWEAMRRLLDPYIFVTIEPILDFNLESFVFGLKQLFPQVVYVGYDNHNCKLPEPPLAKTRLLIKELRKFTTVRVKTLRRAWYEVENHG